MTARSCNYKLYLGSVVVEDQVAHSGVMWNVGKLADRVAGGAKRFGKP